MPSALQPSVTARPASGTRRRVVAALIVWALATAGALAWVVKGSLGSVEREFAEYGEHFHAQIRDKLRANEAVLYGFAAFLSVIPRDDRDAASQYARSILERYPHIYMLEIVRRVPRSELATFSAQVRRKWYGNFSVRNFDYGDSREWREIRQKPAYYPIILAEPESEAAHAAIGLDIDSLAGLQTALARSTKQGTPAASEVFRLFEGDEAFVLFRPVPAASDAASRSGILAGDLYALMVIRARDLLPPFSELSPAVGHRAQFGVENAGAPLFSMEARRPALLGDRLFSPLRMERSVGDLSQPVRLLLERPVGINDLSASGLATVALASLLSLALLLGYVSAARAREQERERQRRAMEHLALHDTLTGLPNRFLLLGRLEQALTSAQRHGSRLAVLFLDLDGFKPVNDRHGHHAGDELLHEIGHRLRRCIRDCDTVARHGGDEFVLVLTDIRGAEAAAAVAEKILQAVAEPVTVGGKPLQVTTSIGIAIYPDSGLDSESLLRAADAAMYEAKAEGRKIFRFAAAAEGGAGLPEGYEAPGSETPRAR